MQEEPNPVKEYLFDYISKSQNIQRLIAEQKFSDIIEYVVENCYDKITTFGSKDETIGTLATGLLHFLLTNALLPSQRKIKHGEIEIDIVIPDMRTLEKDPKKSLIIYIPKTNEKTTISEKLKELQKIQPERQNIWVVLSEDMELDFNHYVLAKNNSFSNIIFDIGQFVNVTGDNKFKILKV